MLVSLRAALLPLLLLVPTLTLADDPDDKQQAIVKQLRQLENDIEKVRKLKFKSPVKLNVIARPKNTSPGLQGYYDVKKKELFVYNDLKGNYWKGVIIHEMVHALQDQHFGLQKLHESTYGSDAELALAALIEGDAQFTTIEVLKKEQPFITKMLNTSLDKSRLVQNAFLYGVGAKYVQELHKRGGWRLVNDRYHFPPTSTATILHPNERITPIKLGPGKVIGEYGLISMFHANESTRPQCMQAAAGWRGDRVIEDHGGSAWIVAFATPEQASTFRKTLTALRNAEYPMIKSKTEGQATVWTSEKKVRVIEQHGPRVLEIVAPDEAGRKALVDRAFGPPRVDVYSKADKKMISFGEFVDRLMEANIICVGENHDDELHHLVQLMVIKALFARDERLGVGMEMFQRVYQKSLDRHVSGSIDESAMLEDTEYKKRWGYDWSLYRPIVDFCRRNRVPLAALNISDELRSKIRKVGVEKLTDDEKKQLGDIDFNVKLHRDHWYEKLGKMHSGQVSEESKERFYRMMTIWDEYMADSAAKFLAERKLRRVVVLAGSGHIDRNFGIPDRAARRTKGKSISVHVHVGEKVEKLKKDPPADFVLIVR